MIISSLIHIWENVEYPFYQDQLGSSISFKDILDIPVHGINNIKQGDVVGIIGDFNPESISTLFHLLDKGAIVVPLSSVTHPQHDYFLSQSHCQYLFEANSISNNYYACKSNHFMLEKLRLKNHSGIVLFTTGTTDSPKAVLHDFVPFIERYHTPRQSLKALSFLHFDHIGGLNTLFHMLFNLGQVISIKKRTVEDVLEAINNYRIELLPTTPTFLRMLSLYPGIERKIPDSLKIITYGTERMDQPTLTRLCSQLPNVDFRQTYGMSELGIMRIKSKDRGSVYMRVGGEGVKTKIVDGILYIKSKNRMIGYLNAESPFDSNGWYRTGDIVETTEDDFLTITGREGDVINVAGIKFMPSEIEVVCMQFNFVKGIKVYGKNNPITGQHVELSVEFVDGCDPIVYKKILQLEMKRLLPKHMLPSKITIKALQVSHRMKKL